jgi:hypothetical protein
LNTTFKTHPTLELALQNPNNFIMHVSCSMKRNLAQVIIGGAAAAHDAVAKQHVEKFTAKEMRDE